MKSTCSDTNWVEPAMRLSRQGQAYVLITLLGARGSTPRASGTKMVSAVDASYGTIGGGQLEFRALEIAAEMLASGNGEQRIERFLLGSDLGQCCGGSHTVLFESFPGCDLHIALFGAGHVGRAVTGILQQLPCRMRWVDSRNGLHPHQLPINVIPVTSASPATEVNNMPAGSYYLIMTHSHELDFEMLKAVLERGDARYIGLIGSDTKWRRFQQRLEQLGYPDAIIRQVNCPVGLAQVPGKHPVEIAVSIAGQIIAKHHRNETGSATQQGVAWHDVEPTTAAVARETEPE